MLSVYPPTGTGEPAVVYGSQRRELARFWRFTRSNRGFAFGLAVVGSSIFLMAFGPIISPYNPRAEDFQAVLTGPSASHWLGTDVNGRDVLSRILSAPLINHTDQELALIEALVGRTPPFALFDQGYGTQKRY